MFKRILVPLDGSSRAESALPIAARVARAYGGSVLLVQAASIPPTYASYLAAPDLSTAELVEAEVNDAERYLEAQAESEALAGIETETKALFGAAAQTILSVAQSYNIDLIVMTSQGKTGLKRWVLGSVAQKIARHASMPVLVLHEGGPIPAGPHPDMHPVRALVPLDGSALARVAIEPAAHLVAALAAPGQGGLHFLRVVKPPVIEEGTSQEEAESIKQQALHRAKTYLSSVVSHLREGPLARLNLTLTWSAVLADDVAQAIIRMAEDGEDAEGAGVFGRCALIAMATHGRSGFQHWVLGSVTERVLSGTKLPILVVRPNEADFRQALKDGEALGVRARPSLF